MSRAFNDITNSFNHVSNNFNFIFTTPDDESEIRAWLSPLEPQVRHRDIRNQRVGGVGEWLLEAKEFRSWYDGSEKGEPGCAALFYYGDPGVGKSYISSIVVDYLCDQAIEQDMAVACFYYDFASREEQSPTNMLGSLLKQLLNGLESIPREIIRKFRNERKVIGGREIQLPDIVNMFPSVSSLQRIFLCIDGFDECVPEHQLEVLDALRQIMQRSANARIFATGRSHIREVVERELVGRVTCAPIKPRDGDIVTYLRAKLRRDTTPEVMDTGLENEIVKVVPQAISESFLLASLKIGSILRETTIHRRRRALNVKGYGLGLGDAYETTLGRIRAQDGEKEELAMTTLMWISHAERPLKIDELRHALAVEIGSTRFNRDNVPAIETILACCHGLVTVDKEALTVRLIHHTLGEYLSTNRNLFPRAHSTIAETYLTYLNSDQVKALSAKAQPNLTSMPFLKYCSRYWGAHAKKELSDQSMLLAMQLLGQYENHIAAEFLFQQILEPYDSPEANATPRFSGLHCASFFGIVEIMTTLLGMKGSDTNQRDSTGMTPLAWAARNSQVLAVGLLLDQEDASPDTPNNKGLTPLAVASLCGHVYVVKRLLDRRDVHPGTQDNMGNKPLVCAALSGHELVVKLFLDRKEVNPNTQNKEGHTPLTHAALNGHESIVKQLLDRKDVNPNTQDNHGFTPLACAAFNCHELVVKLLLDRKEVNPNTQNKGGHTPLTHAALDGRESIVKQLLDRKDVNPNTPDDRGFTPLACAALNGHESIVKRLLDRKDVNTNTRDNKGITPLTYAASNGHEQIVKELLDREDVNLDMPDNIGIAPLAHATSHGHELIVKQLFDWEHAKSDRSDH